MRLRSCTHSRTRRWCAANGPGSRQRRRRGRRPRRGSRVRRCARATRVAALRGECSECLSWSIYSWKNTIQVARVSASASAGYTSARGPIEASRPVAASTRRATSVNATPMRMHSIHDGKYAPTKEIDGTRSQPQSRMLAAVVWARPRQAVDIERLKKQSFDCGNFSNARPSAVCRGTFVDTQHHDLGGPDDCWPHDMRKPGCYSYFLSTVRHVGNHTTADCAVKRFAPELLSGRRVQRVKIAAHVAEEQHTARRWRPCTD